MCLGILKIDMVHPRLRINMRPISILLAATALLGSLPAFAADEPLQGKATKGSVDKNDTYAHKMEVGQLLFFNGDVERAIRAFQRAAELNPKAIEPHMSLMNLYVQKGGEEALANAKKEADEVLKLKPGHKDARFFKASLLKNEAGTITDKDKMAAKVDEAIKEFEAAKEAGAPEHLIESQISVLHLQKGSFDDALKHIDIALAKQPVNPDAHMIRGVLLFRQIGGDKVKNPEMKDKLAAVFTELDLSIKQKEKNPEAHNTKAQINVAREAFPEALAEYEATVKAEPKMVQAWMEMANLCVAMADKEPDAAKKKALFEKSRKAIDQAKKLKPDVKDYWYGSGVIYEKHGAILDTQEAKVDAFRKALDDFTTGVAYDTDATSKQQVLTHIAQLQQALGIAPSQTSGFGGLGTFGMPQLNVKGGQSNVFTRGGLQQDYSTMIKLDTTGGGGGK